MVKRDLIIIAQEINGLCILPLQVVPEVNLATDHSRVDALNTATLACTVTRGNPEIYHYRWYHEGSVLLHESTSNLTGIGIVGIYACEVTNKAGTGMDSIFIHLGGMSGGGGGKRITM